MAETLVRSVKKALDALDCVVQAGGARLSDIAGQLDEKLPTVRNILKTMEACGYLARNGTLYVPGSKCGDLHRGANLRHLMARLEPRLRAAAEKTGESYVATTLLHGHREVICRSEGTREVGVNLDVAEEKAVYSLVTARIMLAAAAPAEQAAFLAENGLPGAEWPEGRADLDAALAALRRDGCATERNSSFCAYACALTGRDHALLGAVGAYAPTFRVDPEREKRLRRQLEEIATAIRESC